MKAIIITIGLTILLTSCATSRTCHNKGHYVSSSIKKAQSTPRH